MESGIYIRQVKAKFRVRVVGVFELLGYNTTFHYAFITKKVQPKNVIWSLYSDLSPSNNDPRYAMLLTSQENRFCNQIQRTLYDVQTLLTSYSYHPSKAWVQAVHDSSP